MKPHQDLDAAIGPGYAAAHQGAALLDRSKRGKLVVNGADRRSYLHAMFTNDIEALVAGTGCYSAYLTPQGRMIADMRVLDLGDVLLLDLDAEVTGEVLQKLDQFVFSEDVQFGDVTATFELLSVVGPSAAGLVSAVLDDQANADQALTARSLAEWPEFHNQRAAFGGEMALVVASRELGPPGFDVFVPSGHGRKLADALRAVGAADLTDEA
ncbi:MAG TPA: hypothetical protein VK943_02640, partial [Arenibaculum sp.]|nr:hypothetical protein [Arenibaculum sp.]